MMLSFSEPSMLPYLRAGIRQANGEDVGDVRVKRQTIRALGKRARALLAWDRDGHSIPYDLHLYWKARTRECSPIGIARHARVFLIHLLHSSVQPVDSDEYQCIRIDGRRGWRDGDPMLFWSPGNQLNDFCREAFNDGFDSPEAFRDYFVPNSGDRFDAILFRW